MASTRACALTIEPLLPRKVTFQIANPFRDLNKICASECSSIVALQPSGEVCHCIRGLRINAGPQRGARRAFFTRLNDAGENTPRVKTSARSRSDLAEMLGELGPEHLRNTRSAAPPGRLGVERHWNTRGGATAWRQVAVVGSGLCRVRHGEHVMPVRVHGSKPRRQLGHHVPEAQR